MKSFWTKLLGIAIILLVAFAILLISLIAVLRGQRAGFDLEPTKTPNVNESREWPVNSAWERIQKAGLDFDL